MRFICGTLIAGVFMPIDTLVRDLLAAIGAMTAAFGSPELALFALGLLAGLLSAPFSYLGRRALGRIQVLQQQIKALRTAHAQDRASVQRNLLDLYRQHAISPWAPLFGFIPAVLEVALLVLLYIAVGLSHDLPAPVHLSWLSNLSARDPVLAAANGVLFFVRASADMRSNPARDDRIKFLLQIAVPVAKVAIAAILPSGVLVAWLAFSVVAAATQFLAMARGSGK